MTSSSSSSSSSSRSLSSAASAPAVAGSLSAAPARLASAGLVRYLVGDIGGTNSRLELVEVNASLEEQTLHEFIYPSQQYPTLTSIIRKFLHEFVQDGVLPRFACFAVAGPVQKNTARITNVNWSLNGDEIASEFGMESVQIINDFVGIGYGLLALTDKDVIPLQDIPIEPAAPKACIGAGTGLGECYLTSKHSEYDVFPSEGGHTDFAARHDIEFRLMQFLKSSQNIPRVSVERCVSGLGIPLIYDFFVSEFPAEVTPAVSDRIHSTPSDKSKIISEFAESRQCPLCVRTVETFVSLYGAEAGNLALKTLCYGGMYIAGGIAPKLRWALTREKKFLSSFLNKGRMQSVLEKIPIFLVIHPQVGLLGAKVLCRRAIKRIQPFAELKPQDTHERKEEEETEKQLNTVKGLFEENQPINEYTRLIHSGTDEKNVKTCYERNQSLHHLHSKGGAKSSKKVRTPASNAWQRWVELAVVAVIGGIVAAAASVTAIQLLTNSSQSNSSSSSKK